MKRIYSQPMIVFPVRVPREVADKLRGRNDQVRATLTRLAKRIEKMEETK